MAKEQWINAGKREIEELRAAVVQQAVDDWRTLCRCKRLDRDCWTCKGIERTQTKPQCIHQETRDCNFDELIRFFKTECQRWISPDLAKMIFEKLQKERRASENKISVAV